jgi:hypothetical protein
MDFIDKFNKSNATNTGLTIGYRRVSGKIGLTQNESGIRGSWVEKRICLLSNLLDHNYKIKLLSKTTDQTNIPINNSDYDYLILEFGGTNYNFYKKDWDETIDIINKFKGKIMFINDDPDLPFLWNLLDNEDWSRWTIAVNALNLKACKIILKCPNKTTLIDLPMFIGLKFNEFNLNNNPEMIYIGRASGRKKYFDEFLKCKQLRIAGKQKEWSEYNLILIDIPQQKERINFYKNFNSSLCVYDQKHAKCHWRTGRAYHAIISGIPVCAVKGNYGLNWCYPVETHQDLTDLINSNKDFRETLWNKQKTYFNNIKFDYASFIRC